MKDKLIKAYQTAWRWPEVYSNDPAVIWVSRAIVFAVPLALIALTVVTGVPVYGWAATGFITALATIGLVIFTVKMFYHEYDSVQNFTTREERIKSFFHGFPAHTEVPLIEYETDEWISYGHVPPKDFLTAIQTVVYAVTEDGALADSYLGLEDSVGHLYATFTNPAEGHWDEGLTFCKHSAEDCFPITRVLKKG